MGEWPLSSAGHYSTSRSIRAEPRGWTPFVGLQVEYSLLERTVERELVPMARSLGASLASVRRAAMDAEGYR